MKFLLFTLLCSVFVPVSVDAPGEPVTIRVTVNEDAILPCTVKNPQRVEWKRNDQLVHPYESIEACLKDEASVKWKHNNQTVHFYRSEGEDKKSQHEQFKNRTSLLCDSYGNISLKLDNVTKQDDGNYTCRAFIGRRPIKSNVNLIVEPVENRNKGGQTDGTNTEPGGAGSHGRIGIAPGVIAVVVAVVVLWMKRRKTTGQEREAQRDNDPANTPMLNINTTTDCARPNTTGHNGQNREGSQEDNAEDNNEDSAEDNAEDNNEDSAEDNAEDNNEDSAEH